MAPGPAHAPSAVRRSRTPIAASRDDAFPAALPFEALDERIAIVGTAGSGKTYAAKGFVERLLETGAHVTIVDPLGVWWGLRASADGAAPGYPVVVFGGRHADVPITADMGTALGRMIAREALVCIVDLSELGSSAARRRFMAAFAEGLYEANQEPLHLIRPGHFSPDPNLRQLTHAQERRAPGNTAHARRGRSLGNRRHACRRNRRSAKAGPRSASAICPRSPPSRPARGAARHRHRPRSQPRSGKS